MAEHRAEERFAISPQLMHETIEGETIMINSVTGNYYSLDRVGSDIWHGIELSASIGEIVIFLDARYEAPRDDIESAVLGFVAELEREDLVVRDAARHGSIHLSSAGAPMTVATAFRPPKLEKHTDMQDLILLDPVHEVDTQRGWPHVQDHSAV